jgi:hypothetical protein
LLLALPAQKLNQSKFISQFNKPLLMLKIILLSTFSCVLCLSVSAQKVKKAAPKTATATPIVGAPIVGNDADAHGCIGSAGYNWSIVKNDCIRLFEMGIRLEPKAAGLDKAISAFVVFKSDTDDAQAELFLPGQKASILLAKKGKNDAGKWTNATYILSQWKGVYTLENKKKKALYQGHADVSSK